MTLAEVVDIKITWTPERVERAAQAASINSLGKAGAYIRGIAAKSIGKSDEASAPGDPPHSRKGQLKKSILFKVDTGGASVVVGPTRTGIGLIGNTHEFGGIEGPKKLPVLRAANWKLVLGGHGPMRMPQGSSKICAILATEAMVERAKRLAPRVIERSIAANEQKVARYWHSGASTKRRYPPRPFMGPALERSKDRLPQMWANSIRGG